MAEYPSLLDRLRAEPAPEPAPAVLEDPTYPSLLDRLRMPAGPGPVGFTEAVRQTRWIEMAPFLGTGISAARTFRLWNATRRLRGDRYKSGWEKDADETLVLEYLEEMEELSERGETYWAEVWKGASELPAWMGEFLATAGVATAAKGATTKLATKLLKIGAEKGARAAIKRGAVKLAGLGVGALARTAALPQRVAGETFRRMLPMSYEFTPQGQLLVGEAQSKPHTAFMKAFGSVWIETFTEETGEFLVGGGKRILSRVPGARPAFQRVAKAMSRFKPPAEIAAIFKRAGYHGLLAEIGEERLSDILRAATGVDTTDLDNETIFERLVQCMPSGHELLVEAGVLALPGASRAALAAGLNTAQRVESRRRAALPAEAELPLIETIDTDLTALEKSGEEIAKLATLEEPEISDADYRKRIWTRFTSLTADTRQALLAYEAEVADLDRRAANRASEVVTGLTPADMRMIQLHLDHPGKYPMRPGRLFEVARVIKADTNESLKIQQSMGYLTEGGWPGDRKPYMEEKLKVAEAEVEKALQPEARVPDEVIEELRERVDFIQRGIRELDEYGYIHRITKRPGLPKRVLNRIYAGRRSKTITRRSTLLLKREFATIEEAEEAGYDVAPLMVSYADMMAKTWKAEAADNLLKVINKNPSLSRPIKTAPVDWVRIAREAMPSAQGRRYLPPIAQAIEELTYTSSPNILMRAYDKVNAGFKLIGFYKPTFMAIYDVEQGWRAGGFKFFWNIPRGAKIWGMGPSQAQYERSPVRQRVFGKWNEELHRKYQELRRAGLFNTVMNWNPAATEIAENMLDAVTKSKGQRIGKWLRERVLKAPLKPVETIRRFNEATTWNIDEVLRIACDLSLQDGRLAKHFGKTPFELTEMANRFMASYGELPKATRQFFNQWVFTPTYRISMFRVLAMMYAQPKVFWPMLMRHYIAKFLVLYALPPLAGMLVAGRPQAGKAERGYRIVVRTSTGKEKVFSLSSPLLEEAKLTGQPILEYGQYQLAWLPNFFLNAFRGPLWRKDTDKYGYLFKLGTPFWRDIQMMLDKDATTVDKIFQLFGLAYAYERRARPGDRKHALEKLAQAVGIWTNWKEQKASLKRLGHIPEKE